MAKVEMQVFDNPVYDPVEYEQETSFIDDYDALNKFEEEDSQYQDLPTTRTQGEDPGASTSGKTLDDVIRGDYMMNVDNFYESVEKRINTAKSKGGNTAFRFLQTMKRLNLLDSAIHSRR